MNYFALARRSRDYHGNVLHIFVRPQADLEYLTRIAQPGDTMHKVPEDLVHSGALVSEFVQHDKGVRV